jgi:hypothetical protein
MENGNPPVKNYWPKKGKLAKGHIMVIFIKLDNALGHFRTHQRLLSLLSFIQSAHLAPHWNSCDNPFKMGDMLLLTVPPEYLLGMSLYLPGSK